jgi:hypothetical protein
MTLDKFTGKFFLSVVISLLLLIVPIYLYRVASTQTDDHHYFYEAVFFWFIGLVFILSERYAKRVYLLHLINHVFSTFAVVGGKYRTRIYGAVFIVVGCVALYKWFSGVG